MESKYKYYFRIIWLILIMWNLTSCIYWFDTSRYFNSFQSLGGLCFSCLALTFLDFKAVIIRPVINKTLSKNEKTITKLENKIKKLERVIEGVLRLEALWMPPEDKVSCEYGDEYRALSSMKKLLMEVLHMDTIKHKEIKITDQLKRCKYYPKKDTCV